MKCCGIFGLVFGHNYKEVVERKDLGLKGDGFDVAMFTDTVKSCSILMCYELADVLNNIVNGATAYDEKVIGHRCKRCGDFKKPVE